MLRLLTSLTLLSTLACAQDVRHFLGPWYVDLSDDRTSSDTGPFFDAMRISRTPHGIRQEIIEGVRTSHPQSAQLFYPVTGESPISQVRGWQITTSAHWDHNKLTLLWDGVANHPGLIKHVLVLLNNRKTLIDSVFLNTQSSRPDQVIVLHRPKLSAALQGVTRSVSK